MIFSKTTDTNNNMNITESPFLWISIVHIKALESKQKTNKKIDEKELRKKIREIIDSGGIWSEDEEEDSYNDLSSRSLVQNVL
jgi:hypothetical protein